MKHVLFKYTVNMYQNDHNRVSRQNWWNFWRLNSLSRFSDHDRIKVEINDQKGAKNSPTILENKQYASK